MQELKAAQNADEDTISLLDIVQFIKASYKKILLLGLFGLVATICFTYILGQYTASITLLNYSQIDNPRIKYLQALLPRLGLEESVKESKNYLGNEEFWNSAVKLKRLIGKSDFKDLPDPASLKFDLSNFYVIEILGKANVKQLAEERAQEIVNCFISGTIFIELRDLVRKYELNIATTNAKLATKILNAEVELAYIDRRIKSLIELKKQYPASAAGQTNSSQLADATDSSTKYLPILTQIIAATSDQNNQNELLLRYKEEVAQMRIYGLFVEKAKPFLDTGLNDPKLIINLLEIVALVSKDVNTNYEKVALSVIEGDLKKFMDLKLYGFPRVGAISSTGPAYLKNAVIGLFGGTMTGILLALGFVVAQRLRVETKSAVQ